MYDSLVVAFIEIWEYFINVARLHSLKNSGIVILNFQSYLKMWGKKYLIELKREVVQ